MINKSNIAKVVFISTMTLLLICSCKSNANTNQGQTPTPTISPAPVESSVPTNSPESEQKVKQNILASEKSQISADWTDASKYRYDIDGDGERETVRLSTSAKRGEDGLLELDDGNSWILEVNDGADVYTLFNDRVQLGRPVFDVYENADGRLCIRLTVSTGAGYEVKCFTYEKSKKAFIAETVYSENGINVLYNGIPT